MSLTQWGAALVGCATLLLTACTVVDLDENGKPIIPADPQAKASFDNQTPDQIAQQTRIPASRSGTATYSGCFSADHSPEGPLTRSRKRVCTPDQPD